MMPAFLHERAMRIRTETNRTGAEMVTLNKAQRRAASPDGGVTLVIAGAGTGKTRTIIEKINAIIRAGVARPDNILVLTFSRKAADEIRHRVMLSLGEHAGSIVSGTFHSFCLGLLRDYSGRFFKVSGYTRFPAVLDETAKEALIMEILRDSIDSFLGLPVGVVYSLMNDYKKLAPRTRKKLDSLGISDAIATCVTLYSEAKKSKNVIDYEDMIDCAITMIRQYPDLRGELAARFTYVLVDEFQDTSSDNFELLHLVIPVENPNLFVVGDDFQSIYGFRNSRIDYIVNFKKYFRGARIIKLNLNYRSRKEIVAISNSFIKKNRFRTNKTIRSHKGRGGSVTCHVARDFKHELNIVHSILEKEILANETVAILFRNNWQGRYINLSLRGYNEHLATGKLQLMTMHSSKGLEFDTVIVAGVTDDILPDADSDIEEERRLMYVAMTRARERLYIICHGKKDAELPLFGRELKLNPIP